MFPGPHFLETNFSSVKAMFTKSCKFLAAAISDNLSLALTIENKNKINIQRNMQHYMKINIQAEPGATCSKYRLLTNELLYQVLSHDEF